MVSIFPRYTIYFIGGETACTFPVKYLRNVMPRRKGYCPAGNFGALASNTVEKSYTTVPDRAVSLLRNVTEIKYFTGNVYAEALDY
jgi:hypothetical protein